MVAIAVLIAARRACKLDCTTKIEQMFGVNCADAKIQKCVKILESIERSDIPNTVEVSKVKIGSTRIPEY